MALNGIAPIIIFTFFVEIPVPAFLRGFVKSTKIPLIPIPIYLKENFTKIALDDYEREISIDVLRDESKSFERVSSDLISLKFKASKSNVVLTAITAFIDLIVNYRIEKATYGITIFYDNIFVINASLENFQTRIVDGTDVREIILKVSNRPKEKTITESPIANTAGTVSGF